VSVLYSQRGLASCPFDLCREGGAVATSEPLVASGHDRSGTGQLVSGPLPPSRTPLLGWPSMDSSRRDTRITVDRLAGSELSGREFI
jgi:hypothetical protein